MKRFLFAGLSSVFGILFSVALAVSFVAFPVEAMRTPVPPDTATEVTYHLATMSGLISETQMTVEMLTARGLDSVPNHF